VLREACRQVVAWRQDGVLLDRICVNISPFQLSQPGFSDLIEQVIEESGLPAECLELEITESSLLKNPQAFHSLLDHLKGRGVKFAIDDFGTGYSSLNRLNEFDVDRLKIDRSFISNLASRESDVGIVSAIINMGRTLGLEVIAEGIEHPEQAEILRSLGCEQIQGYLISKPLPSGPAGRFIGDKNRRWPWATDNEA
jgi:EAL domain-containing protein (putative c-di-GMP-specific phosphodiesterase class I)